ncbi:MAG: hypothetical protein AUJ72_03715 [Candidatus Omnitrophica bacterium CG1_02_46_14]|nr:MAG: hypothetical protein AUJ72_03715 [Candidatus Omnitrophica bacterium CG1_02_46_14]
MTRNLRIPFFLTCLLFCLGALSFQIDRHLIQTSTRGVSNDPLYRLLGSAKEAIGDTLFLKASSYFHGGVDVDLIEAKETFGAETRGMHDRESELMSFEKTYGDWVYKINSRVKVMGHKHLEGEETKEILPLLTMAVKLDPYNVTAILTTAYWLNNYFGKTDAAIEILKQGLLDNPDSWEMSYRLGLFYFKYKKDYTLSSQFFERSLEKMNKDSSNRMDHRDAAYFLAESYKNRGLRQPALQAYRKTLTYFAESENPALKSLILQKIKDLTRVSV